MVSKIFYFHPYLGKIPILTNILNHQPVTVIHSAHLRKQSLKEPTRKPPTEAYGSDLLARVKPSSEFGGCLRPSWRSTKKTRVVHKVGPYDRYKWTVFTPMAVGFFHASYPFNRPLIGVVTQFMTSRGPPCSTWICFTLSILILEHWQFWESYPLLMQVQSLPLESAKMFREGDVFADSTMVNHQWNHHLPKNMSCFFQASSANLRLRVDVSTTNPEFGHWTSC